MPPLISARITQNNVPVLDVSEASHALTAKRHDEALDPDHERGLLTGTVLIIDNPRPIGAPDSPDRTIVTIGGSTLHEAATEVIAVVELQAHDMPHWVASTDAELSKLVAEHFCFGDHVCTSFPMNKVPS